MTGMGAVKDTIRRFGKLLRLLGRREFRRGLRFGVAASVESLPALRNLEVATVIDVGANVGQFSLLMTALRPSVAVHAFEPLESSAAVLGRLFAGNPRVRLHRCAVGASDGEAKLHVSRRADNSSLLPIGPGQIRFAPGTDAVAEIPVPVRRLDSEIPADGLTRPILLKLDVQGGELLALAGGERLLEAVEHVYVEVSFTPLYDGQPLADAIIDHLRARGFALAGLGGFARGRDGRIVQADLLLSRRPA
ncbi:FkbM family methyltransferase [Azospirillum sp.]|uniref:FkbM family methyltransferase n=1 Tax=Azospirillum sp. TaxID=34012 RepID=UPI003D7252CA